MAATSDQIAATNEAKTRDYYERVWNQRDLELLESWVTPNFVGHYSAYPEPLVRRLKAAYRSGVSAGHANSAVAGLI